MRNVMKRSDITPMPDQTVAAEGRARIWSAMIVIAFIVAAGLFATALDIPHFIQAGLTTEPLKTQAAESGTWRHYEPVY
jgi:hypothetical protein